MKKLVKLSFEEFLKRIPYSIDAADDTTRQFNCKYAIRDESDLSYLRCAERYEAENLLQPKLRAQIVKRWQQSADAVGNNIFRLSCVRLKVAEYIYQVDMGNNTTMICDNLSSFNKASNTVGSMICCYSLLGIILLKGESDVRC